MIAIASLLTAPSLANSRTTQTSHFQPAIRAGPNTFTTNLWGRIVTPVGWGLTSTTVTQPGVTLTVATSDSVTLSLFSGDGAPHRFCVDYNNNGICDPAEPESAQFTSSTTATTFSFTATATAGSYTYYCVIHGFSMSGPFIVKAPDVAVALITTSRNSAYNGVTANPVKVNVTASNLGLQPATFFVSAKANTTLIGNQTVTIPQGQNTIVSFQWNANALNRSTYILTAQATKVPGETNTSNNSLTDPTNFTVKHKGDVNGDCKIDIVDLATVGTTFGKTLGSSGYNSEADLNNDGTINIVDLVIVASSFGQIC